MRNLKVLAPLLFIFAIVFTSCSDDDDDSNNSGSNPAASTNPINFDGNSFNLRSGLAIDYGPLSFGGLVNTHYNYDFITIDGTISIVQDPVNGDEYIPSANSSISVYLELFAPDSSTFKTGTFSFIADSLVTEASVRNNYFFSYGNVELDTDGVIDGVFSGPDYDVVGGSVAVSGTGPSNYKLTYNLQLEGNRSLTGTYTGSFIYIDDK